METDWEARGTDGSEPARGGPGIAPWLPYRIYAKVSGVATGLFAGLCVLGLAWGGPLRIPGFIALAGSVSVAIVWLVFLWLSGSHVKKAAALLAGKAWVRWRYAAETWRGWVDERKSRGRLFALIFTGVMAGVGLLTGILLNEDGTKIGGSALATVLVPAAAGFGVGILTSAVVLITGARVNALLRNMTGICVISPVGFYIPGIFWEFNGFGTSLTEVARKDDRLVFEFEVSGGRYQNHTKVRVPVPPGKEKSADRVAAALGERL